MIRKSFKYLGYLLLVLLLYVVVVLLHGTLTDFQPTEEIQLKDSPAQVVLDSLDKDTLSVMSWNLGYAGLSAEVDFFYPSQGILFSGDKTVHLSEEKVDRNITGIKRNLKAHPVDFYLLQEVDSLAKRSHYRCMIKELHDELPEHNMSYAVNFNVQRVPTPVLQPWRAYGQTHSGLATYSKYKAVSNVRYQLPGKFSWPNSVFLLDRCLAIQKIPTTTDRHLYLVNLHNSAYDRDGALKAEQMDYLKRKILPWYANGDYVIVGGDWNQPPPNIDGNVFNRGKDIPQRKANNIAPDYLPEGWTWLYDPTVPTVRSNHVAYDKESSPTGLIDYFLISPNIHALEVKGLNLEFAYSDHQPVKAKLVLQ